VPASGARVEEATGCDPPRAGRTTGGVPLLRHTIQVAWKDLRVELRSREIVYTTGFFAILLVVVFSFAFPRTEQAVRDAAPGMLWVAMAFAGTVGLGRAFDREREGDTMRALLLSPAPRLSVFLGKAIAIAALIAAVSAIVMPLLWLFLQAPVFTHLVPMAVVLVLGAIGFAIVGTVFAAMLLRVRSRDVLLPVVLYPILVPLFIAGTSATAATFPPVPNLDIAWYWIQFLAVYDAIFFGVALWTFESLVIE
jgi:heme exporter protein B